MLRLRLGCVAFVLACAADANAQQESKADTLFNEANTLAAAGRYAEACPKLAESNRLEPAVGTQFNLADCYEHLGKTATAFAQFNDVVRIARSAGKFERERLAKDRANALEPRLARVRIVLTNPAPGEELEINESALTHDRWNQPTPVDPGHYAVGANAPGRTAWEGSIEAKPGETAELTVPELVDPNPPKPAEPRPSSTQRTLAFAVGGVGVAGLVVGALAGGIALGKHSSADKECPESTFHFRCPTTKGTDDWNSATSAGTVSTIGFVVGGIALAGAAVLWFTAPSGKVRAGAAANGLRIDGIF